MRLSGVKQFLKSIDFWMLVRYGVVGTATFILNVWLYTALRNGLHQSIAMANSIAFVVAVTFSFVCNKYLVFLSRDSRIKVLLREIIRFLLSRILNLVIDNVLMYVFVWILLPDLESKIIVNFINIPLNYILSKFWVFRIIPKFISLQ